MVSNDLESRRAWLDTATLLVVALPVVLVLLVLASVTLAPAVLGWQSLVVTSGSMAPAIPVGSVVVIDPGARHDLQVGDVVAFVMPESGLRVTHRVIEVRQAADGTRLVVTRGDANNVSDGPHRPENILGKAIYWVPYVGWIAYGVKTPLVRVPLVLLVLGLAVLRLRRIPVRAGVAESRLALAFQTVDDGVEPPAPSGTDGPAAKGAEAGPAETSVRASRIKLVRGFLSRIVDVLIVALGILSLGFALVVLGLLAVDRRLVPMPDRSMEPAIPAGSMLIVERAPVGDVRPGEVIVFAPIQERGKIYVRRVIKVEHPQDGSGGIKITTQGDNLPDPDPFAIDGTQTVGRVTSVIPVVGGVLAFADSGEGFLVLGALILLAIVLRITRDGRQGGAAPPPTG